MNYEIEQQPVHSGGWIAQVWIAFGVSVGAGLIGIYFLDTDPWIRAFLALAFTMAISSSISLSKTLRDIHEAERLVRRIDDAKVTKLLSEHTDVSSPRRWFSTTSSAAAAGPEPTSATTDSPAQPQSRQVQS
jgi:hypothetical protein